MTDYVGDEGVIVHSKTGKKYIKSDTCYVGDTIKVIPGTFADKGNYPYVGDNGLAIPDGGGKLLFHKSGASIPSSQWWDDWYIYYLEQFTHGAVGPGTYSMPQNQRGGNVKTWYAGLPAAYNIFVTENPSYLLGVMMGVQYYNYPPNQRYNDEMILYKYFGTNSKVKLGLFFDFPSSDVFDGYGDLQWVMSFGAGDNYYFDNDALPTYLTYYTLTAANPLVDNRFAIECYCPYEGVLPNMGGTKYNYLYIRSIEVIP